MNIGESQDFQAVASYLRDRPKLDTQAGANRPALTVSPT